MTTLFEDAIYLANDTDTLKDANDALSQNNVFTHFQKVYDADTYIGEAQNTRKQMFSLLDNAMIVKSVFGQGRGIALKENENLHIVCHNSFKVKLNTVEYIRFGDRRQAVRSCIALKCGKNAVNDYEPCAQTVIYSDGPSSTVKVSVEIYNDAHSTTLGCFSAYRVSAGEPKELHIKRYNTVSTYQALLGYDSLKVPLQLNEAKELQRMRADMILTLLNRTINAVLFKKRSNSKLQTFDDALEELSKERYGDQSKLRQYMYTELIVLYRYTTKRGATTKLLNRLQTLSPALKTAFDLAKASRIQPYIDNIMKNNGSRRVKTTMDLSLHSIPEPSQNVVMDDGSYGAPNTAALAIVQPETPPTKVETPSVETVQAIPKKINFVSTRRAQRKLAPMRKTPVRKAKIVAVPQSETRVAEAPQVVKAPATRTLKSSSALSSRRQHLKPMKTVTNRVSENLRPINEHKVMEIPKSELIREAVNLRDLPSANFEESSMESMNMSDYPNSNYEESSVESLNVSEFSRGNFEASSVESMSVGETANEIPKGNYEDSSLESVAVVPKAIVKPVIQSVPKVAASAESMNVSEIPSGNFEESLDSVSVTLDDIPKGNFEIESERESLVNSVISSASGVYMTSDNAIVGKIKHRGTELPATNADLNLSALVNDSSYWETCSEESGFSVPDFDMCEADEDDDWSD